MLPIARLAGLHYISDQIPGWQRKRRGQSFIYIDGKGHIIREKEKLKRISSLGIPPAWQSVWICPDPLGHLQATGKDSKGRKQYRYHAKWTEHRNENKFSRMLVFADKLPKIRRKIAEDLKSSGLPKEKVLAAIVQIMEKTMIRIGNEEYAEKNKSYGLTTIRNHHVQVEGQKVYFRFKGKSGKHHDVELKDPKLAKIIRKCQELPGQELFAYLNEEGQAVDVTSSDVNQYLKDVTGEDITAKDFRTWGGTVQAAQHLCRLGPCLEKKNLKSQILRAVEHTAQELRNTPMVCRKYYIHPCVIEAFENGTLFKIHSDNLKRKTKKDTGLYPEEIFAVQILQQSLQKTKSAA